MGILVVVNMILTLCLICFLILKNKKSNDIDSNVDSGDVILKNLKPRAEYTDIDPNNELLRDLIESAKVEKWNIEINLGSSTYATTYDFFIRNSENTITMFVTLRIDNERGSFPCINNFLITTPNREHIHIRNIVSFVGIKAVKDIKSYRMVLEYLWSLLVEKYENDYNNELGKMKEIRKSIEKELKFINRNKKLENLFG